MLALPFRDRGVKPVATEHTMPTDNTLSKSDFDADKMRSLARRDTPAAVIAQAVLDAAKEGEMPMQDNHGRQQAIGD